MKNRHLRQPGPVQPDRIECYSAPLIEGSLEVSAGAVLIEGIAEGLEKHALRSAALDLSGIALGPMQFVMPSLPSTDEHVAYYSKTHFRDGPVLIEQGTATYGVREAKPFLHGHVFWHDEDGSARGGHILPYDCILAEPARVPFKGCREISMAAQFDPETNFTVFGPIALGGEPGDLVVARLRPNVDLIEGIEQVCRKLGIEEARLLSLIGSTIGARHEDGLKIDKILTEILGLTGQVTRNARDAPQVDLEIALIDVDGGIHRGKPVRGYSPVLILAEVFLQRTDK